MNVTEITEKIVAKFAANNRTVSPNVVRVTIRDLYDLIASEINAAEKSVAFQGLGSFIINNVKLKDGTEVRRVVFRPQPKRVT